MNIIKIAIKKVIPKRVKLFYHYILSFLASLIYSNPSNKLIVIGITGTSGKTSSTYLMAKALNESGYKTGYTSTAMFSDGKREWLNDKKMTMLGPFFTQKILRRMLKNSCLFAIVETTSEGIKQFRHRFINYDILVFTGLYPEHIESHGSFENYKQAKGELFKHLKRCKLKYLNNENKIVKAKNNLNKLNLNKIKKSSIINGDDKHSSYFASFWSDKKIFYSNNFDEDKYKTTIFYQNIKVSLEGSFFDFLFKRDQDKNFSAKQISLKLWGDFNVVNSVPLLSLPFILDFLDLDKIVESLEGIKAIPGRMELIDEGQKFLTIVDYAYEPVAMGKMYNLVAFLKKEMQLGDQGRIIHILGSAGGGRDKSRREVMGKMAGEKADIVIITNEDPYDENPLDIINQVARGAKDLGKLEGENLFRILDRREAIKKALYLAKKNDIIILTGKGCEQAICLAQEKKIPWDDRLVVKEELLNLLKD